MAAFHYVVVCLLFIVVPIVCVGGIWGFVLVL